MILMVEPSGKAGLCHYTYNLCNALAERGNEVHLLTATKYELDGYPIKFHVERLFNRYRINPFKLAGMLRGFRRVQPYIVHFQGADHPLNYLSFLYMLRIAIKCPVVYTAHNLTPRRPASLSKKVGFSIRNLYRIVDRILVHSEISRRELINLFHLSPRKIEAIPVGASTSLASMHPGPNDPIWVTENTHNEKYILFFGYIVRVKGLIYLIRAMKEVVNSVPGAKLLIVGFPSEDFTIYREEIRRLGLEDDVTAVLEYVPMDDVSRYFSMCHVVALPYLDVSQSGVLQMAYAFGKPVVATTIGGLPELVEEGTSGFLVPPRNSSRLSQALISILKDDVMRRKMGAYNFNLSRKRYRWSDIAERTESIYLSADKDRERYKIRAI